MPHFIDGNSMARAKGQEHSEVEDMSIGEESTTAGISEHFSSFLTTDTSSDALLSDLLTIYEDSRVPRKERHHSGKRKLYSFLIETGTMRGDKRDKIMEKALLSESPVKQTS